MRITSALARSVSSVSAAPPILGSKPASTRFAARAILAGALGGLLLTHSGQAVAQVKCPVVSSLLSDDAAALDGVGITINDKGLLNVTKAGLPGAIRNAASCDIGGPVEEFDLSCSWSFPKNEAKQAERQFDQLKARLEKCLPTVFEDDTPISYSAERLEQLGKQFGPAFVESIRNTTRLRDMSAEVILDDGVEVDFGLDLSNRKDSGVHRISLSISRY